MVTLGKRSLLVLGLLTALLGTAMSTAPATAATSAPATPTVQATLHDNWAGMNLVPANLRYEFTAHPRYALQVTGANFKPGAKVNLALIDTATLRVLHRGSTYVEREYVYRGVLVQNPRAGTFEYNASLNDVLPVGLPAGSVHLWCRSASHMDFHEVIAD